MQRASASDWGTVRRAVCAGSMQAGGFGGIAKPPACGQGLVSPREGGRRRAAQFPSVLEFGCSLAQPHSSVLFLRWFVSGQRRAQWFMAKCIVATAGSSLSPGSRLDGRTSPGLPGCLCRERQVMLSPSLGLGRPPRSGTGLWAPFLGTPRSVLGTSLVRPPADARDLLVYAFPCLLFNSPMTKVSLFLEK